MSMNIYNNGLSVTVITNRISKTPKQIRDSFIFDEIHHITQKGIKIHVVRFKKEKDSFSNNIYFHGIERKIDAKTIYFMKKKPFFYPPISLLRNPKILYKENLYALNVIRVVKRFNTDLIHAHFAYPEGLVGLFVKRHTNKPLVITLHGYDILTEASIGYGARLNKKINPLIEKALKRADAIITASRTTYNEAKKIVKNSNTIHLIPNSVDITRFNPTIDGSNLIKKLHLKDRFIIFSLRNHEVQYGLKYLIQAFSLIKKIKENTILILGGSGTQTQYLKALTKKLCLEKDVIFTGQIPRDDVPVYYAASDVVIIPSLQEAFGLVITEAMACGKPVIGSNIGGIPDQIFNDFNGFLVKPKDSQAFAKKILYLYEHPNEAKLMGRRGRKIVEEKFDSNKRINRILSLYRELIKK